MLSLKLRRRSKLDLISLLKRKSKKQSVGAYKRLLTRLRLPKRKNKRRRKNGLFPVKTRVHAASHLAKTRLKGLVATMNS
jgi:hypothetical protein